MKTVAIVGTERRTRDNAPWDDQNIDIWVLNQSAQQSWVKRWTGCLQIHREAVIQVNQYQADHWEWMQKPHDGTIYMIDADPLRVPASARYPLPEIIAALPCEPKMFGSSVSYTLALAAYLKYDKVELYGMEMQWDSEYGYQRESFTYWVGFLQGLGIHVERHCADNIFVRPLYGQEAIWYQTPERWARRITVLDKQIRLLKAQMAEVVNKDEKAWIRLVGEVGEVYGRKLEAERYHKMFAEMVEKTGEAIMDTGEPERLMRTVTPEMSKAQARANRADGARDQKKFTDALFEFAQLKGRIEENKDLLKEAPK